jgi:putative ABC transport system ATP-binding protein
MTAAGLEGSAAQERRDTAGSVVAVVNAVKEYRLGNTVVRALRGVDLEIGPGEFSAIVGPSGSGKTTLLNLIGCVDVPTTGTVMVAGQDTTRLNDRALTRLRLFHIGFVFQSFNLVPVLSALHNVELPLVFQKRLARAERLERARRILEKVGLGSCLRHRPSELSGGQRQRVAIARALVTQPDLILADEPTANLDSATGTAVIELMKEINEKDGTTFLFSTHDAAVMKHAHRVLRLADGTVCQ